MHKNKIIIYFIIGFFLLSLSNPVIPSSNTILSTTYYVGGSGPGNYSSIQEAIDQASNGDTVFVYNGSYFGHVLLNKSINFFGEDKNSTIIIGYIAYTISFVSDWINMSGFTINNSGRSGEGVRIDSNYNNFYNNIIETADDNVRIAGNHNNISHNKIRCDILILSGHSNTFLDNTITNDYYGIYFTNTYGNIILNNSFFNSGLFISEENVWNREVKNNTVNGKPLIYIYEESDQILDDEAGQIVLMKCSNITIQDQEILNTTVGIQICESNNCTINGNTISDNLYGIWMNGRNNTIQHNNITKNSNDGLRIIGKTNILSDNIISNNNNGMYLYFSDNNTIKNNSISTNHYDGIQLNYRCDNNIISNNTIINNNDGINIYSSNDNLIYNNYISNINNFYDIGNNRWNISKTLGTNIINGPYIGGNYWSDYNGIDNDGDGLGDTNTPYGPGDYLPLTYAEIQIDINQSNFDRGFPIRHAADGDWAGAQSFLPTNTIITESKIYLRKFGNPEFNLTINLRTDHPQGPILDTILFTPEQIPDDWTWAVIDFDDTLVTSDVDYFIVCPPAPSGVTTSFGYEWGYAFGNQYDAGAFWFTRDGGSLWRDLPTSYEFTFRTYGYN